MHGRARAAAAEEPEAPETTLPDAVPGAWTGGARGPRRLRGGGIPRREDEGPAGGETSPPITRRP